MSIPSVILSPQQWTALYRRDDGEQQPISPVERDFGAESHGKRHGLDVIRAIVEAWGHPELKYPTVHVAGSKGKGSTVAMLSSILQAAGYRVGSYTSPSLTHFGERIRVNGQPFSDAKAETYVSELLRLVPRLPDRPRFFEAATAIAFQYFSQERVDVAVIEVGIGGRLDATNVVMPEIGVITSIELEHTQILGDTVEAIAREKAGIIKPGVPTITAVREPRAIEVIEQTCVERRSTLWRLGRDFGLQNVRPGRLEQQFDLWTRSEAGTERLPHLELGLPGEAQGANAALASVAARLLGSRFERLTESAIRNGLRQARCPGRLELITGHPSILLDVAHTPASAHQLRGHLDRFFASQPKTLVVGMLRDKRHREVAAELAGRFDNVLVAPVKWFRSMSPDDLREAFTPYHNQVQTAPSICSAVERAVGKTTANGLVVVAGSLFAVGEAKRRFGWSE